MASSYARKQRKAAEKADRKARRLRTVYVGTVEDGSSYLPHPRGGIIILHPSHLPIWVKPDGTKEELQP